MAIPESLKGSRGGGQLSPYSEQTPPPRPKQEKHTEAPLSLFPFMWLEKSRDICFPAASRFPPKKSCHLSTLA